MTQNFNDTNSQSDRQKRTPRKYEYQIRYVFETYGLDMVNDWVIRHGTVNERLWWAIKRCEDDTGERFTNAEQIVAWGKKKTQAIRVAGFRLQEKLIKAFMETKPQQQACRGTGSNNFCAGEGGSPVAARCGEQDAPEGGKDAVFGTGR